MRGSIRRKSRTSWELTIDMGRDSNGKRLRTFVNVKGKKADADKRLRELITQLEGGLPLDTSKITVSEYLPTWIESHTKKVRNRTIYGYRNVLNRYVIPTLGTTQLNGLQPRHIEGLYSSLLEQDLSPRTVLQLHRIFKKAMSQAVRWNMVARNPLELVDPPTFEAKETHTLDISQLNYLFEEYGIRNASLFGCLHWTEERGIGWIKVGRYSF